jgi:hypothetical protein
MSSEGKKTRAAYLLNEAALALRHPADRDSVSLRYLVLQNSLILAASRRGSLYRAPLGRLLHELDFRFPA